MKELINRITEGTLSHSSVLLLENFIKDKKLEEHAEEVIEVIYAVVKELRTMKEINVEALQEQLKRALANNDSI